MIVFRREPQPGSVTPKQKYSFIECDTSLLFEFTTNNYTGSIELDKKKYQNTGVIIFYGLGFNHVPDIKIVELTKLSPLTKLLYAQSNGYKQLAKIIFDDKVYCSVAGACEEIANVKNIIVKDGELADTYLEQYSPVFCKIQSQFAMKSKLFASCDIFNSLSYLECQLDLISKIILESDLGNRDDKELLGKFMNHSVLDIKSNVESEIANKKNVRQNQVEYYRAK